MEYSLKTLRKKAHDIGYHITKGVQHFQKWVWRDYNGERHSGFMVMDMSTGIYEWGCYNENFDYLWSLEDVVTFLKGEYDRLGLAW